MPVSVEPRFFDALLGDSRSDAASDFASLSEMSFASAQLDPDLIPNMIGPFDLQPTTFGRWLKWTKPPTYQSQGEWHMPISKLTGKSKHLVCNAREDDDDEASSGAETLIRGVISPLNALTLSLDRKRAAGIPEDATHYGFAQVRWKRGATVGIPNDANADLIFLAVGGFVYFSDESTHVTALKATEAGGLAFGEALPWEEDAMLYKHRFVHVTDPRLRDVGVTKTCWLVPHEVDAAPHGALAYMFSESKYNRLFPVCGHLLGQKVSFPMKLGPFDLRPTKFRRPAFQCSPIRRSVFEGSPSSVLTRWSLPKSGLSGNAARVLKNQLRDDELLSGCLSPMTQLTLSADDKEAAGIAEDATAFCFAYPAERDIKLSASDSAEKDPDLMFLTFGGFLFFDTDSPAPEVMAAVESNAGLAFADPIPWRCEVLDDRQDLQARVRPVSHFTVPGAKFMCWLLPGEIPEAPHGALVFLFHSVGEGTHHERGQDVLFPVRGEHHLSSIRAFQEKT